MSDDHSPLLDVLLAEYNTLKAEQTARTGFRDNLLYVTLGVYGAVFSYALSNKDNHYALLVIPWVCLILGWTYLVNDQKISAIGEYIRDTLTNQIQQQTSVPNQDSILGWEIAHRNDEARVRRKLEQLLIDWITFVCSGIIAIAVFWTLVKQPTAPVIVLCTIEFLLLLALGIEIGIYADFNKGK